jgi:hypothetical protein
MSVLWRILSAITRIAIAFWPVRVTGRTGHSFTGHFIFSLFFFPAAVITACLVHDHTEVPGGAPAAVSYCSVPDSARRRGKCHWPIRPIRC